MANDRTNHISDRIARIAAPVSAVLYVLVLITDTQERIGRLGWHATSLAIFVLAISWSVFCWTAKEMTRLEPRNLRHKYGLFSRLSSFVLVVVCGLGAWYATTLPGERPDHPLLIYRRTTIEGGGYGISAPIVIARLQIQNVGGQTARSIRVTALANPPSHGFNVVASNGGVKTLPARISPNGFAIELGDLYPGEQVEVSAAAADWRTLLKNPFGRLVVSCENCSNPAELVFEDREILQ